MTLLYILQPASAVYNFKNLSTAYKW